MEVFTGQSSNQQRQKTENGSQSTTVSRIIRSTSSTLDQPNDSSRKEHCTRLC